jgi:hypothetical protein
MSTQAPLAARPLHGQLGHPSRGTRITRLLTQLGRESDPATRAGLLDQLAAAQQVMANRHLAAASAPRGDESTGGLAESLTLSARLVRLIAGCEHSIADTGSLTEYHEDASGLNVDHVLLMFKLCRERDRNQRAELIGQLHAASAAGLGERGGEVLLRLAESERKAAAQGARSPRAILRAAGSWAHWAAATTASAMSALVIAIWCTTFLGTPTASAGLRAGVVTAAVFWCLTACDTRLHAWRASRRCEYCGNRATPGHRLRFYRLKRLGRAGRLHWLPRFTALYHHPSERVTVAAVARSAENREASHG